jgi:hypothetical protein
MNKWKILKMKIQKIAPRLTNHTFGRTRCSTSSTPGVRLCSIATPTRQIENDQIILTRKLFPVLEDKNRKSSTHSWQSNHWELEARRAVEKQKQKNLQSAKIYFEKQRKSMQKP